jgi:glycogen synthase
MPSSPRPSATVIVLSLSHIPSDSRVQRQCRHLTLSGFRVIAIGLPSAAGEPAGSDPSVAHRFETLPPLDWSAPRRVTAALALLTARIARTERVAGPLADGVPGIRAIRDRLREVLAGLGEARPVVIVANDWATLPAALWAHRHHAIPFHYDTHEIAAQEHAHSRRWRLLFPPLIEPIERLGLARAASISCVSPGIAVHMAQAYGLARQPDVQLSLPDRAPLPPRQPSGGLSVLYHGIFTANRGLEQLIASAQDWPPGMRLVLRGRANAQAYQSVIERHAARGIGTGRIVIEPLVAPADVVDRAHAADLGVFLPDITLNQNRLALPNKLFEYLYAGLIPVVPAHTEMAALLGRYGAGVILADASPAGLASALRALTPLDISGGKERAHRCAKALHTSTHTPAISASIQAAIAEN